MAKRKPPNDSARGEVLVAILNDKKDFAILREKGWYRIPTDSAPKRWPPQWLAFYQTKIFGEEAYSVRYYGRVRSISMVRRRDLFPNELPNPKSDRQYYKIQLESLRTLNEPIASPRWRRIAFIPTTWPKFRRARQINDLFDESPLEDILWDEFKRLGIAAERQFAVPVGEQFYRLDFAIFCNNGNIDVETDGDSYHIGVEEATKDRLRENNLTTAGWQTLRFNGNELREKMAEYCVPKITGAINRFGGLQDDAEERPRVFYSVSGQSVQQLSLFETESEYGDD
ncbi:MAG: DUF559 domain-containing protein [Caldilineales bacterium]|nr:DUF559 domain-containing protein [Caldilineales bacterium]